MIQFLHSGLQGAPSNTANAGAVCSILDDCLVNGFNVLAPVTATISGGVATFVYASAHGYTADQYLRVAGAGVSQVNGDKLPTILDAQTLSVPAPGAPDGPAGGSVNTRFAPLGWETAYADTNVRVYRSPDVTGSRLFYRLQDTSTASFSPSLRGYESMTDANNGTNPFPSVAQKSNGQVFYKSGSATARNWLVVGDQKTFYLLTTDAGSKAYYPISAGEFNSYVVGDASSGIVTSVSGASVERLAANASGDHFVARNASQLTPSFNCDVISPIPFGSGVSGAYPSLISGGATFLLPLHIQESTGLRGQLRGIIHVWEPVPAWPFAVMSAVDGIDGRVLCCMAGTSGRVAFRLDEPW